MAMLVFFIKKMNGLLKLVQDYRMLNIIIIKNKYLLSLISVTINTSCFTGSCFIDNMYWGVFHL